MKFLPVLSQKDLFIILLGLTLSRSRLEERVMKGERIWGIYCNGVFLCCITDRKHDHAQSISGVENVSPEVSPLPKAGWKKCLFSVKGGGCGVVSLVV